jgi:hypothetical protein
MIQKHANASIKGFLVFILALINVIVIKVGFTDNPKWYYLLLITIPLLVLIGLAGRRSPDKN